VQSAMNPGGYHIHAGEVLMLSAPDKTQATPAWYYISDHQFNLDILGLSGSVIGTNICTWLEPAIR
jgi:hypothetical protein